MTMTKREAIFLILGVVLGLGLFAVFEPPSWGDPDERLERENALLRSENQSLQSFNGLLKRQVQEINAVLSERPEGSK